MNASQDCTKQTTYVTATQVPLLPETAGWGEGYHMPRPQKFLVQIRLSDADRRRIKSFAAKQGLTLQDAVVVAFDAWAEKLRAQPRSQRPATPAPPQLAARIPSQPSPSTPLRQWVQRALQLDWTKCPEVELLGDDVHQLWVLRATDAPLAEVLRAVADRIPAPEIAEIFDLELTHLAQVLEFARAVEFSDALN
jgi:hypothetical protein